jgi:hypothetical protein
VKGGQRLAAKVRRYRPRVVAFLGVGAYGHAFGKTDVNPLEASLVIALPVLALHFLGRWYLARLDDPRYLRTQGVVVRSERALETCAAAIGYYAGHEIYAAVRFKGMRYRFDRVAPRSYRFELAPGELYLEPGLVYLLDP